ncbi:MULTISPECIES: hypothetical protein [Acinetobacter]|uniref:hypothetical protein n=1 Tax=Acinetobacter TaxID=469 RepID=UPI001F069233|nr:MULTISPECIES: hypothetical protein [Acinetobacter]MCH2003671.1 hypothetical protein [Acinetobacter seifertii]WQF74952.1 hypothetical protein OKW95_19645 [Acinetobacter oleivorans]
MSNTTKVLREQSGIQFQGVQDKSEADPRDTLSNAVFTGIFKRGRFDKPMKVTSGNIRAKLGYDPSNLAYMAVEDCLKTGVPFVWVQRTDISCDCESSMVVVGYNDHWGPLSYNNVRYRITLNQKEYVGIMPSVTSYSAVDALRSVYGPEVPTDIASYISFYSSSEGFFTIQNLTPSCLKIKIQAELVESGSNDEMLAMPAIATIRFYDVALCAYEPR